MTLRTPNLSETPRLQHFVTRPAALLDDQPTEADILAWGKVSHSPAPRTASATSWFATIDA